MIVFAVQIAGPSFHNHHLSHRQRWATTICTMTRRGVQCSQPDCAGSRAASRRSRTITYFLWDAPPRSIARSATRVPPLLAQQIAQVVQGILRPGARAATRCSERQLGTQFTRDEPSLTTAR